MLNKYFGRCCGTLVNSKAMGGSAGDLNVFLRRSCLALAGELTGFCFLRTRAAAGTGGDGLSLIHI
eukprot:13579868-Alexandrium_andersonii.AAC.1